MSVTFKVTDTRAERTARVSVHHFRRANGEPFTIELTLDITKIAEDMAASLARNGKKRATKAAGGIVAKVQS